MGGRTGDPANSIRVLHVDDEPAFADMTAAFLEREDERFTVETATSASDGLARLSETTVDCIVSDYDMPGQNGIAFLEAIRADYPALPFVLFTGKGSEEIASEAISAGVSDNLRKGTGTDRYSLLANRIENLVSQYQAESQLETRAEQQRHVAALGKDALAGAPLETLFERAVELVADTLDSEYAKVLEYRPGQEDLLLRAGVGWRDGLVGEATVGTDENSQAGHTIRSEHPIVVEDLRTEERFRGPPLLVEHDVVSGISVVIGSPDEPWGVLGTHTTEYTSFTDDDITFVQNVANVLATAIERRDHERERVATIEFLQTLYDVATDRELPTDDKISRLLELGPEKLGLPYGHLTRIERPGDGGDGTQTIIEASGNHDLLQPGDSCPLSQSYCRKTIEHDGLLEIQDALAAGWAADPAFRTFDLGCYIGTRITVNDELYGTVFFAADTPRDAPFTDAERTFVRLMSQLVSYELERKQAVRELERQNEQLDAFASVVSHDLRNPLQVAEGRLELISEECDSEHIDGVARAHDRMQALIDDLLTLARAGEGVKTVEPVALSSVVERSWRTVAPGEATLTADVDQEIQADQDRLQQLLENLLRNAIEHGGEDVTVSVGDLPEGFYVEDDGPGIPEGDRDAVFEAGYSTTGEGTGFGLSIVKQVTDGHGWDVCVTEGASGGARFEITGTEATAEEG